METVFLVTYWEENCCSGHRYLEFADTPEDRAKMDKFVTDLFEDGDRDIKVRKITVVQEYDFNITLVPKTNK
jgi:hypothetical protein